MRPKELDTVSKQRELISVRKMLHEHNKALDRIRYICHLIHE